MFIFDIPAISDVMNDWPTDVIISDWTIGNQISGRLAAVERGPQGFESVEARLC